MPLHILSPYIFFFNWIVLTIFPYVYFSNYIYEPLLLYFTGTSLYYSYFAITHYKLPVYFRFLFLFVFVLCIYGVALVLIGDDIFWVHTGNFLRKYLYILWLISALVSVVPVYVFTCRGWLDENKMRILFVLFFAVSIYAFYGALELQIQYAELMGTVQDEYTITSVYSFLSIMPLLILFKKKPFLQFAFLSVILVYLVLSAKRGAIALGGASALVLIFSSFVQGSFRKKIWIALGSAIFFAAAYQFINHQMASSPYFAARIDQTIEGQTSGRDRYAKIVYDYYVNETNTREFFFGIGAQGTLSVNEHFAHNDWLAILLEQGLFGAILFLLYWIGFVYTWIKAKHNSEAFVVIGILLFIGLGKTIFSMYYLPISPEMMTSSGFFAVALGFYLGKAFPQHETYIVQLSLEK